MNDDLQKWTNDELTLTLINMQKQVYMLDDKVREFNNRIKQIKDEIKRRKSDISKG